MISILMKEDEELQSNFNKSAEENMVLKRKVDQERNYWLKAEKTPSLSRILKKESKNA